MTCWDRHIAMTHARPFYCYPIGRSRPDWIHKCAFRIRFGERIICSNGERASERANRSLSAKYARSHNYAEGLSHSSSAVVIAYQRSFVSVAICPTCRAGKQPAGYPELLVGRLGRSVAALTSDDRVVAKGKKRKKETIIIIIILTTRRCLIDRRNRGEGKEMREGGRTAIRRSMEEKGEDRNNDRNAARMCLLEPVARMNQ